jgi:hypothetical protein
MSLTYETCLKAFPKVRRQLLLSDSNILNVTCGPVGIGDMCNSDGQFNNAIMLVSIQTLRPMRVDVEYMGDKFPCIIIAIFPDGRICRAYDHIHDILSIWTKSLIVNEAK